MSTLSSQAIGTQPIPARFGLSLDSNLLASFLNKIFVESGTEENKRLNKFLAEAGQALKSVSSVDEMIFKREKFEQGPYEVIIEASSGIPNEGEEKEYTGSFGLIIMRRKSRNYKSLNSHDFFVLKSCNLELVIESSGKKVYSEQFKFDQSFGKALINCRKVSFPIGIASNYKRISLNPDEVEATNVVAQPNDDSIKLVIPL